MLTTTVSFPVPGVAETPMMLLVWALEKAFAMSSGLKTLGEKTLGEKTEGLKTLGEKTDGEKTEGLKTLGEKTEGLKTTRREHRRRVCVRAEDARREDEHVIASPLK